MDAHLQRLLLKFQHLEIPLEEIKSATDNFNSDNCIGVGGYGKVYKGVVSHYMGQSMVAIKRLGNSGGQGTPEFLKEITTLSRCNHENVISLLGYCYQGGERILVYQHASRGSLDRCLNSPDLKWSQRIKICLDAAKGLSYLHDPGETNQRLIHCDIKSANILLDDQWNAKVSDFGLSIVGSANAQHSVIVTLAAGTLGYIDPLYMMTHTLTKESDVYSFGVVLFEVLCGSSCYTCSNGHTQEILVPAWIESYKEGKLNDIIFKSMTVQRLEQSTLEIFSNIAYRCLNEYREEWPMMTEVITELKAALERQEVSEWMQLFDYEEMIRSAEPLPNYNSSLYELWKLLIKGVLLNNGKTWFSLNQKGEHCEMISIAECLASGSGEFKGSDNSRFPTDAYCLRRRGKCKLHVKTNFLSPGITYTLNLVLRKRKLRHLQWVSIQYKLEGETETSNSYIAYESDGGYWWMCELYQFTSDQRDHEFLFEFEVATGIEVEGIDFRPMDQVEHTDEKQHLSDSDANWKEKLPANYWDILVNHNIYCRNEKEAYSNFCSGLYYSDDYVQRMSIDNNGNLCILKILPGDDTASEGSFPCSNWFLRFEEVYGRASQNLYIKIDSLGDRERNGNIIGKVDSDVELYCFAYLVYKLPKDVEMNHPVLLEKRSYKQWYIYLAAPETPVTRPKAHQNSHNPFSMPNIKGLPQKRDDGWMEVQIWESWGDSVLLKILDESTSIAGLIIQGIELKIRKNLQGGSKGFESD